MGKDSTFYKEKKRNQTKKLRELLGRLPGFAVDYIYSKELTAQPSTLVSYAYDLITFFTYIKDKNPLYKDTDIREFSLDILTKITPEDISEYQRYLELNLDEGAIHENGKKAIARKMAPLRGMYQYHLKRENIERDPTVLVELPRLKKEKNIIRMSNYEVQELLETIRKGNEQMSKRQRAYCLRTQKRPRKSKESAGECHRGGTDRQCG